ncbi:carbohydrate-responsive element-binding protein-like [Asterias rubens]|uniref:carbohydrate-responsive element-binding protein-like n=1 Tax=Asterias rubens TaxID=7604 RepID=UPI001455C7B0|nr:carbohydrate-responsive element-binding protein-like [Asterias rubens]
MQAVTSQLTNQNQPLSVQQQKQQQHTNIRQSTSIAADVKAGRQFRRNVISADTLHQHQQTKPQQAIIAPTPISNQPIPVHLTRAVDMDLKKIGVSKATASSSVKISQMGVKPKNQAIRPRQPAKIAPAPPAPSTSGLAGNAALITQLLTQGAIRQQSSSDILSAATSNTTMFQPVKTEFPVTSTQSSLMTDLSSSLFASPSRMPTTTSAASSFNTDIASVPSTSSGVSRPDSPVFSLGASSSPGEGLKIDMHISAEQKRRVNIKSGFDTLHKLIPALSQNPNAKVSKASMLQKGIEYLKKVQAERAKVKEEIDVLQQQINGLQASINESQNQLPASGVTLSQQRSDHMRDVFDDYVRERTKHNWKFWIFSIIIRPLFESYNTSVSTTNTEELCKTVISWLDQYCSLPALRPTVLSSLTVLIRTTSFLTDPAEVPRQAAEAVNKKTEGGSETEI